MRIGTDLRGLSVSGNGDVGATGAVPDASAIQVWLVHVVADVSSEKPVSVGQKPVATAVSGDQKLAYVVNQTDGTASIVDTNANSVVAMVAVGANPSSIAPSVNSRNVVDSTDVGGMRVLQNEPQQGWVQCNEVRLHYWDWPGDDPPIVCLHALTFNGRFWETLAEQIGSRHRIIAPDLRGRGLSDKPPAGSYGWEQHASDVAAAVRELGIRSFIAVGHSLGGYVSVLLAAQLPELVQRLVVVDAGLGLEEAAIRAQGAASLKQLEVVFPSTEAYFEYWRQVPAIHWTTPFERYLLAGIEQRADGTVVSRTFPPAVEEDLLFYFQAGAAESFAEAARRIQAPTALCWAPMGLLDPHQPLMSRQGMDELARLIPQAQVVPIDGTNHYTILLLPEAVDRVIEAIESGNDVAASSTGRDGD